MASRNYAGLSLSVIIILLVLEYSNAIGHEGNGTKKKWLMGSITGKDVSLHNDVLRGRKMLQKGNYKSGELSDQNSLNERSSNDSFDVQASKNGHKSDDSKTWLEETREVENLMQKDYKGGSGAKPRRKPPINNNEPND